MKKQKVRFHKSDRDLALGTISYEKKVKTKVFTGRP
jgi:hypothetical protein